MSRTPVRVARQDEEGADTQTAQPHVVGPFGDLTTYAQLAAFARLGIHQVTSDLEGIPASDPVRERAAEWMDGLRAYLPYLDAQGEAPLTAGAAGQAELHVDEGIAIQEAIAASHRAVVSREMRRVRARARAAAAQAEALRPRLHQGLRAAYRAGEADILRDISGTLGSILDISMGLHDLARESVEAVATLRRVEVAPVGRFVQTLNRLNRGLAAVNLALTLTQDRATTELEEGMRQLSVATSSFSSLATLAGLPAHMGLYANLYLVPLTNAIMAKLSVLTTLMQEQNDIWVAITGRPGNFYVEPGGRATWQFMVRVMQADSFSEMPRMTSDVSEYFLEHRSLLEAGSGETVPTEGWWFWRDLDSSEARHWVYANRTRVWAMFYGNRVVPRR